MNLITLPLLLIFSVTPFKIYQSKNQNRSIDKVRNLGNEKGVNIQRPLSKFRPEEYSVYEISEEMFYPRDLYGDAMLVPTLMGTNMRRTETNENICYRVLVQKLEFIPRGTNKH